MSTITENDEENAKEKDVSTEPIFYLNASEDEPLDEAKVLFSIYNEIKPDKKKTNRDKIWSWRMICVQEWFIRCSWINKFLFLELLCHATQGCSVLENILQSIESIFSKDVLESLSSDTTSYCYDKIPTDDNRALDAVELNKAMKEDYLWFLDMHPNSQVRIILRLLRLGGGGLVLNVYRLAVKIYKERQIVNSIMSSLPSVLPKPGTDSKQKVMKNLQPKASTQTETKREVSALKEFAQKKLKQLERREEELLKYKKLKGLLAEDNKIVKKGETGKEAVDYLQILPIRLNRKIMSYIDDKTLSGFKKVGKYWGKMIDESINEKSGRKAMNVKINKIIGIKADTEEKKNGEKSEKEEVEFITELGAKDLINKKNENEKALIALSELYEVILSKKCEIKSLNSTFHPERCGAYDNVIGILACSSPNNVVHFYSVRTGARFNFVVFGLESTITCLTLHENRTHIFFGCRDGSLISKDMRTNKTVVSFNGHTKAVLSVFTTSSNLLSAAADNTIKYFQLWSGLCLLCIDLSSEFIISSILPASDKSPWTAIGTREGVLIMANIESKTFLTKVKLHTEEIRHLANDGDILITGSSGGKIRVWNMNKLGDQFPTLKPYYNINVESPISSLRVYKNQIFSGCKNGTVKVISLATGKIFKTLKILSQTPIKGLDITEDKLFMKLIIWHEKGIEIRSFSLQKSSFKKVPLEKDNQESKQKAPKETKRNEMSQMASNEYFKNNQTLIEAMPNAYKRTVFSGNKKSLNERCCTSASLRNEQGKSYESKSDIFTRTFNMRSSVSRSDLLLYTFPRAKV